MRSPLRGLSLATAFAVALPCLCFGSLGCWHERGEVVVEPRREVHHERREERHEEKREERREHEH